MEQLLGTLEIRVSGCNVVETELRQLREKRQVRVQMSPEAVHAFKPRIDETECHHRGKRNGRVVEHGKFIDEIAIGEVALDSPGVAFVGQDFLVDALIPGWAFEGSIGVGANPSADLVFGTDAVFAGTIREQ
jgi:hypothetical protein